MSVVRIVRNGRELVSVENKLKNKLLNIQKYSGSRPLKHKQLVVLHELMTNPSIQYYQWNTSISKLTSRLACTIKEKYISIECAVVRIPIIIAVTWDKLSTPTTCRAVSTRALASATVAAACVLAFHFPFCRKPGNQLSPDFCCDSFPPSLVRPPLSLLSFSLSLARSLVCTLPITVTSNFLQLPAPAFSGCMARHASPAEKGEVFVATAVEHRCIKPILLCAIWIYRRVPFERQARNKEWCTYIIVRVNCIWSGIPCVVARHDFATIRYKQRDGLDNANENNRKHVLRIWECTVYVYWLAGTLMSSCNARKWMKCCDSYYFEFVDMENLTFYFTILLFEK